MMISYTAKDIEAIAMVRPVTAPKAYFTLKSLDAAIAKGRKERSDYIVAFFAGMFAPLVSAIKAVAQQLATRRKNRKALAQLAAMSSKELADIGLIYGDIEAAVYGPRPSTRKALMVRLFDAYASAASQYNGWQNARAGYAELNALDDRTLADLGIVRTDLENVVKYGRKANDNLNTTAANDDHRIAG